MIGAIRNLLLIYKILRANPPIDHLSKKTSFGYPWLAHYIINYKNLFIRCNGAKAPFII